MEFKRCPCCNEDQPINKFLENTQKTGTRTKCSSCAYRKKLYTIRCMNPKCLNHNINKSMFCYICLENKVDSKIKREKRIAKQNNNLDYFMNSSCSQNYKNEITPQEYKNKYDSQEGCCFWCNIVLTFRVVRLKKGEERLGTEMVLDRKDNSDEKHTCPNTVLSCYLCNNMRGNLGFDIFSTIINILKGNQIILDITSYKTKTTSYGENGSNSPWKPLDDMYSTKEQKSIFFNMYNDQGKSCALSGLPFAMLQSYKTEYSFTCPSVDRITSKDEQGNKTKHSKENVHLIWSMFNRAKLDLNLDSFNHIMRKRFPKWEIGYQDVEVIYPENHENNWLENYICKDEEFMIKEFTEKFDKFENWVRDNKRKPVSDSENGEEKTLAKWWNKINRPSGNGRNHISSECNKKWLEFKKTDLYCEYLMTNEEKVQKTVDELREFLEKNHRIPSCSKNSQTKEERELARKYHDIKCRLDRDNSNMNPHYNILRDFMKTDIYQKYINTGKKGTYYHKDQKRLKEQCDLLMKIGDGKVYGKTFDEAKKLGLTKTNLFQRHKYKIFDTVDNVKKYAKENNIELPHIKAMKQIRGTPINVVLENDKIYHK